MGPLCGYGCEAVLRPTLTVCRRAWLLAAVRWYHRARARLLRALVGPYRVVQNTRTAMRTQKGCFPRSERLRAMSCASVRAPSPQSPSSRTSPGRNSMVLLFVLAGIGYTSMCARTGCCKPSHCGRVARVQQFDPRALHSGTHARARESRGPQPTATLMAAPRVRATC